MSQKIKGKNFEMDWRGGEVLKEVEDNLIEILAELGLAVESEAKQELKPGHGVKTGTLRRSIHTAKADYNWAGDDVEPSKDSPDLGGQRAEPSRVRKQMTLAVGSGLRYALPVHQGHGSFAGYHFMTNGLEKARKMHLKGIVEKHQVKR